MATSGGEAAAAAGAPATEADSSPGWEVAVRPLLSASYSAFEMKELPQLVASVIERYRAVAPSGRAPGGGGEPCRRVRTRRPGRPVGRKRCRRPWPQSRRLEEPRARET